PGSRYRFDALFTIGQIYKEDLDDAAKARSTFEEFLRRYPRNHLADEAKSAIAELDEAAQAARKSAARKTKAAKKTKDSDTDSKTPSEEAARSDDNGKYARVTGLRHWSTPNYTRVAIDVEQDVKFESERLEHPERIFFDLQNTKLASTLVGKTFDVDDGFLKKVRVAQFQPGRTRIVLEVEDSSEYNAFLLPNPSRLIIDIHGKQPATTAVKQEIIAKADATKIANADVNDASCAAGEEASDDATRCDSGPSTRSDVSDTRPQVDVPRSPSEAKLRREIGKPPLKVGVDWRPIPRTIVEADEDEERETAADVDESDVEGRAGQPTPRVAGRKYGKVRSSDGNNDEVAILSSVDVKSELIPTVTNPVRTAPSARKRSPRFAKAFESRDVGAAKPIPLDLEVREAKPTARGDRSLIRALGLKIGRIVIDPGHGGHDTGTIGPNGLEEKDLVLDVAKRLGKLLDARLGADVVYTRQDDTFIPLETRTAIANQEQADLFVSIHANSSRDPDARGVETYYL